MKTHYRFQDGYGAEHFSKTAKHYYHRKGGKIPSDLSAEDKVQIEEYKKKLSKAERQVYFYTYEDERRLGQSEVAEILGWKSRGAVFNVQKRLIKKLGKLRPLIKGTVPQQEDSPFKDAPQQWEASLCSSEIEAEDQPDEFLSAM